MPSARFVSSNCVRIPTCFFHRARSDPGLFSPSASGSGLLFHQVPSDPGSFSTKCLRIQASFSPSAFGSRPFLHQVRLDPDLFFTKCLRVQASFPPSAFGSRLFSSPGPAKVRPLPKSAIRHGSPSAETQALGGKPEPEPEPEPELAREGPDQGPRTRREAASRAGKQRVGFELAPRACSPRPLQGMNSGKAWTPADKERLQRHELWQGMSFGRWRTLAGHELWQMAHFARAWIWADEKLGQSMDFARDHGLARVAPNAVGVKKAWIPAHLVKKLGSGPTW